MNITSKSIINNINNESNPQVKSWKKRVVNEDLYNQASKAVGSLDETVERAKLALAISKL